jgi:hypothetical protein
MASEQSDTPEFQHYEQGPLFVVRWRRPTIESSARLGQLIERHAKRSNTKLAFGAIIGVDCPAPSNELREAMVADYSRAYEHCESARMIILGSGMGRALVRSVLATMGLARGLRGKGFAVDGSAGEAASLMAPRAAMRPDELLAALRSKGLLDAADV